MRACLSACAGFILASCSTLEHIHDPQFGILSSREIPSLLQSLRCELITFYADNKARKQALDLLRDKIS